MTPHPSKQKAMDEALWLNFKERLKKTNFGVIASAQGGYFVVPTDHVSFEGELFEQLPIDHSSLSFKEIQQFRMDESPLWHWEELAGVFAVMNGELLRYVLHANIPLEKLIRYELASRGFDKNHEWCGFEKAQEIWLKD